MKNISQKQNKLNIRKTIPANSHTGYGEWLEEFKVSSAYIKPTPYFQGNELNFNVYRKPTLLERAFKFLNRI